MSSTVTITKFCYSHDYIVRMRGAVKSKPSVHVRPNGGRLGRLRAASNEQATSVPTSGGNSSTQTPAGAPQSAAAARDAGCPFFRLNQPLPGLNPVQQFWRNANTFLGLLKYSAKFQEDPLKEQTRTLGGNTLVPTTTLGLPGVIVGSGKDAKHVLSNEVDFAPSESIGVQTGPESVLAVTGDIHAKMRSLMQPFFAPELIEKYCPDVEALSIRYLDALATRSAGVQDVGQGPQCHPAFELFAMENVTKLIIGVDLTDAELAELRQDYKTMSAGIAFPFWWDVPFTPFGQAMNARRRIQARAQRWVAAAQARQAAGAPVRGILDNLASYRNQNGQGLSDSQLLDNTVAFIFAGYDTTAATLTTCVHFLHSHPHVWKRLRQEQQEAVAKHGRHITLQVLKSMKYAERVIREVMRLQPVVPALDRQAAGDMVAATGDVAIRQGDYVEIPLRALAMNDPLWAGKEGDLAPEVFNPDRWLQASYSASANMPFGHGRHMCLGMPLAMMEVKVVLAILVRGYELVGVQAPREWRYAFLLTPDNGLPLLLRKAANPVPA